MNVTAVIVNYRTPELTLNCLQTLAAEREEVPQLQVCVVEGGSGDNSATLLEETIQSRGWTSWVTLRPLDRNGGFAYANNAGIEQVLAVSAPPDFIWLLNPDTLIRPGATRTLMHFLTTHTRCGIVGARLEDPDQTVQSSAFRFHSVLSEIESALSLELASHLLSRWRVAPDPPSQSCQVDWVCGASMMVRLDVFRQIGLLDAGYFMYFEETDFCLTAAKAGWETWYLPQARVVHLVGQSSGVTSPQKAQSRRPGYWFDSRHRYFRKNCGIVATLVADLAWTVIYPAREFLRLLQRKPATTPAHFWRDFVVHEFRHWTTWSCLVEHSQNAGAVGKKSCQSQ